MTKDYWLTAAFGNDVLVAQLLLRLKQSDSSFAHPPPATATTSTMTMTAAAALSGWGNRKSRSKPPTTSTTTTTTVSGANGFGKEHQRGSPTTPLSWTVAGASTSDGCDEFSRKSDLSSGGRSNKVDFANEDASTSNYSKSLKRKSFVELKDEEGFLLKERVHLNRELASMRVNFNQQMATSENLKRIKIDMHQKDIERGQEQKQLVEYSCRVESEIEDRGKGFVVPDLNMTPTEEELGGMS